VKCPKCGYLGFETVDRCRNCGYDFSLRSTTAFPELPIRRADDSPDDDFDDLALIDGAAVPAPVRRRPEPQPARPVEEEFPLFDDPFEPETPMITRPSAPRAPLAVRRATPDLARVREPQPRAAMLDLVPEDEDALSPPMSPAARARTTEWTDPRQALDALTVASAASRMAAAAFDLVLLGTIDLAIVYFTMQICGVGFDELHLLPKAPLATFLAIQNGGYLVAFTAAGQTLGKMLVGIKVIAVDPDAPLDAGRAIVRTAVWVVLAAPVGVGFISMFFNRDRRGLHDRVAGTRVVRALAS
jgi:uncharacterized RDD family membrane protein YckC